MDHNIDFQLLGIATVLQRYRLRVPPNQREYSWQEEQVLDLLQDVQKAMRSPAGNYFLGTIVMTSISHDEREVADGQQRLATTTILLAVLRDYFLRKDDRIMSESIEGDFLSKIDRSAGERVPKLTLNIDDNEFFKNIVIAREGDGNKPRPTRVSHKHINKAREVTRRFFENLEKQVGPVNFPDLLKEWISYLENKARVVALSVSDENNAFVMFETLNDRGIKTSQADLVKNYLFKESGDRLSEAQSHWSAMRGAIEAFGEEDLVMEYLRLACRVISGATRERDVMNRVTAEAKNKSEAIRLLHFLGELANDYAAILNADHPKWNTYDLDIRKAITTINYLGVTQIRPLMLAVARYFPAPQAVKAFRRMVAWSVRFLIVGGRGGKLDEGYARLANDIHKQAIKSDTDLKGAVTSFVPSDGQFRGAFELARVSVNKLARYYLRALEMTAADQPNPEWIPNDGLVIDLEHVMPESAGDDWTHVSPQDIETHANRIGNLALLQAARNSQIGNASFATKRAEYMKSSFLLTSQIGQLLGWGKDEIEARQKTLADLAVKTWPLD